MKKIWCFVMINIVFVVFSYGIDKIVVFHAGSLTVPFSKIEKAFERENPNVDVQRVVGGSRKLARMIVDTGAYADIFASADYTLIEEMLVPEFADRAYKFASNEMVLCYTQKSKYGEKINSHNWYEILAIPGVQWGHSEPDLDPCGYRTIIVIKLAEKYYKIDGLAEKILKNRPLKNVRPKSVELISLLKEGILDYAWEYKSVAVQHGLKYLKLPDEINLSSLKYNDFYSRVKVKLSGKKPKEFVYKRGKAIIYGIALLKKSENKTLAKKLLDFILDKNRGGKILEECGQKFIYNADK